MAKEKEKNKDKSAFYYLKETYKYGKEKRIYLFMFILGCIIYALINIFSPLLGAQQILKLTNNLLDELFFVTLLLFGIEVLRNTVIFVDNYFIQKYILFVKEKLRDEMIKETLKIDTKTLNANSSGLFIERIGNDVENMASIIIKVIDYGTIILSSITVFVSIFFLNKAIFFLYLIFILTLFFSQKRAANKVQEKRKIYNKKKETASGFVTELVRGAKDIKILNAEESFALKAHDIAHDMDMANYTRVRVWRKYRMFNGDIRDLLDFCILMVGIFFIKNGSLSISILIIILNYRGTIMSISGNIEYLFEEVKSFSLAAQRVFDVLDSSKFPKEVFGEKHISKLEGSIKFHNVSFKYDDSEDYVLKDINLEIKPNETISFVGKSGSGKSTMFNLISALYYPSEGDILLDGNSIFQLDKDSIRGNLSVISQSPYIFNMSIKDNLQIIKKDASTGDIIEACKLARLHDFIMTLPNGYDTVVGEGGVTLSGGQKQRLAIARALLLKTEIILFDEATSALDNETQAEIQESIRNMQGEYTILIIAHRLSTVIHSDRLVLIDDGKILDIGTHQELIKRNEFYKNLYELELKEE